MIYSLKYTTAVPGGFAGATRAWFIYINPAYKDDLGLLAHEKIHVKQFWTSLGFSGLLYLCFKKYRLAVEVAAYREQLCWPPAIEDREHCRQHYAEFLSTRYGLNITVEEASKLL